MLLASSQSAAQETWESQKLHQKNPTLKGIPHSYHFTKHQRPEDTEAAQWIIQATFIGAFQVYNGH